MAEQDFAKQVPDTPPADTWHEAPSRSDPARRCTDGIITRFAAGTLTATLQWPPAQPIASEPSGAALLLELESGDAVLIPIADAQMLIRGEHRDDLHARAAAMARALQHERERVERRLRMPDLLLAYADALLGARCDSDVYTALRYAAGTLVRSWTALVFVAGGAAHDAAFLPLADPFLDLSAAALPARTATWFARPLVITRAEIDADARRALAPLAVIMDDTGAAQLLCAPVAGDALLVLIERRRDRVVTAEERDLVNGLVSQAEGALRRLGIERQVAAWALQDQPGLTLEVPLT